MWLYQWWLRLSRRPVWGYKQSQSPATHAPQAKSMERAERQERHHASGGDGNVLGGGAPLAHRRARLGNGNGVTGCFSNFVPIR